MRAAFINHLPIRGLNVCVNKGIGIHVPDAHPCHRRGCRDESFFDGKPTHGAEHIAAIRRGIYPAFIDNDLNK